ncbi:MAG: FadR family transcriptional regulator [Bradyrhizobiaceae bacterium]|nr:MAG: FadR family transcriptional regulator [Bradyrhizobiaceae bacterium]
MKRNSRSAGHRTQAETVAVATLTDGVADALGRSILDSGTPGESLPTIVELSASYGVSSPVVREALARLKSEGSVRIRQGAGAFVADRLLHPFHIRSPEVIRVLELRLGVETEAAALAAARADAADLKRIEAALEAMRRCIALGEDASDADLRFHQAIARAARNPLFVDFVVFLHEHLRDGVTLSHEGSRRRGVMPAVLGEHEQIVAAIIAADVDAAREAARRHLLNGIARLKQKS